MNYLVTIVLLLAAAHACLASDPPADATANAERRILVKDYLQLAGQRLDCYFTVEEVTTVDALPVNVTNLPIWVKDEPRTQEDVLRELQKRFPDVKMVASPRCPVVFHIYGPTTTGTKGYWLDRKISMTHSGALAGLLSSLETALDNEIAFINSGVIGSPETMPDFRTHANVAVEDWVARDAITCFLPLSQRRRILWHCTTIVDDQPLRATLWFGLPIARYWRPSALSSELSFALGEEAFRMYPVSADNIRAAAEFISQQMEAEKPHQVRWAMFFLGKGRAVNEMPLLFKHIAYKYSDGSVVEEMYPAVGALAMMGAAAADEALKQLQSEEDPVKLELLVQVVRCVMGKEKAGDAIRDKVLVNANVEQKARIEKASQRQWPSNLPVPATEVEKK